MLYSRKPSRRYENRLRRRGFKLIAGLDEVGKGAWAGPLVAAAVILPDNFKLKGIKDSKLLSQGQREWVFVSIIKNALQYSIAVINQPVIDQLGITQANVRAFRQTIQKLQLKPDYLLLDGREISSFPIPHEYLINGDGRMTNIAAASIIAKVTRDELMKKYHEKYPDYGFDSHKGYGTFKHLQATKQHGPCPIHRLSFRPFARK